MNEDSATEMIEEYQDEQVALDTISKLENREEHSVLEADMVKGEPLYPCLLYTSPSPRDKRQSRMTSSA